MSFFMKEFGRTPHKKLSRGSTAVNLVTIGSKCCGTIRSFTIRSVTIRRFASIPDFNTLLLCPNQNIKRR